MAEWRVTFGQRHRGERHTTFREAHPDGWLTILAEDYSAARSEAFRLLGREWAQLYSAADSSVDWARSFPRGELARFAAPAPPECPDNPLGGRHLFADDQCQYCLQARFGS